MSIDDEIRRIAADEVARQLPDAIREFLSSMMQSDRREVPRIAEAKALTTTKAAAKPKQKRNDGKCHFPGCSNDAKRPLRMFCAEEHGKLSLKDKAKYNAQWKKAHG